MGLWAAVPQEANFSLIGCFGNCLFGGEYGRGEYSSRGEYASAKRDEYSKPGQIQKDKLATDATSADKKGDQPPPKAEIEEKL